MTHHPGETGQGWLCSHEGDGDVSRNLLRINCADCLAVVEEALDRNEIVIHQNGAIAWRDIGVCTT